MAIHSEVKIGKTPLGNHDIQSSNLGQIEMLSDVSHLL